MHNQYGSIEEATLRVAMTGGRLHVPPSSFLLDFPAWLPGMEFGFFAHSAKFPDSRSDLVHQSLNPWRLRYKLKEFRPAIIHQHWSTWSGVALHASTELSSPLVTSVHGYDAFLPKVGYRSLVTHGVKSRHRARCLASSDAVVVNSDFMYDVVSGLGVDANRLRLIRHGVEVEEIPARGSLAGPHDIVFAGRLSPEKGIMLLLEALTTVPRDAYGELLVLGDGSERAAAERYSADKQVPARFFGMAPREVALATMKDARLVVVPSVPRGPQQEASGLTPVESQMLGTATVVTRVGGLPETISPSAAIAVAEPEPEDLGRAIRIALTQAEELGALGREFCSARYSRELFVNNWTDLYAQLDGHGRL